MTYRYLDPKQIQETAVKLRHRISERFPDSGLSHVSQEVVTVADKASAMSEWISRPIVGLRAGVAIFIVILLGVILMALFNLRVHLRFQTIAELLQGVEAAVNDIVFIGLAILFLVTWENRIKRSRALKALHELRSLAHIIDMHQLTKDPERITNKEYSQTKFSPNRNMTPFQLGRYLDYCSELLAIISKIAAVYVSNYNDSVTLGAVNEVENLTSGLSRKIWQKIMILDRSM
jgi:hypothetical protein